MSKKRNNQTKKPFNGKRNEPYKGKANPELTRNHPAWYSSVPELVKDVASLSYNTPVGEAIDWTEFLSCRESTIGSFPGIMAIDYLPTLGNLSDSSELSAIQVAATQAYAWVRHANSGSRNYEAVDLLQYIMAVDGPITLCAIAQRAYGLVRQPNVFSKFYLHTLVKACGFDYDDLIDNQAKLRYGLNAQIARLNALNIPNIMPIFNRHLWLASTIFKDTNLKKHQLYLLRPIGYYQFRSSFGEEQVGGLEMKKLEYGLTVDQFLSKLRTLVDQFYTIEDLGIISGDVRKAYNESGLMEFSYLPEDYMTPIVYDEDALTQISGAALMGTPYVPSFSVVQDAKSMFKYYYDANDPVLAKMSTSNNAAPLCYYDKGLPAGILNLGRHYKEPFQYFNSYKDDPTPDDNMVMTRLTCFREVDGDYTTPDGGTILSKMTIFGTEVCTEAHIFSIRGDNTINEVIIRGINDIMIFKGDSGDPTSLNTTYNRTVNLLNSFKYAPVVRFGSKQIYTKPGEDDTQGLFVTVNYTGMFTNIFTDNYITITPDIIKRMNYVAIQSLFGIPTISTGGTQSGKF